MAYGPRFEALEIPHLAHIIRDVFPLSDNPHVITYQFDDRLMKELRKPEHSLETWCLYTSAVKEEAYRNDPENVFYWEIGINGCYFGETFCDLFISWQYTPVPHNSVSEVDIAEAIKSIMKPNGLLFFINGGLNRHVFEKVFSVDVALENEVKRYGMMQTDGFWVMRNDL